MFLLDVLLKDLGDGQVGDPEAESSGDHSGQENSNCEEIFKNINNYNIRYRGG